MQREEVEAIFDEQAGAYDRQWDKLAPLGECLHALIGMVFGGLADDARILCVGAGTGAEVIHLATRFPRWEFTVVEPSAKMLAVCRRRAEEHGITARCVFHEGYLDSLPGSASFDAATSLLVSQFFTDRDERSAFFRTIAARLRPDALLASADLVSDIDSAEYRSLLEVWLRMLRVAEVPSENLERMPAVYKHDVAVLPPKQVSAIIASGGFEGPVQFFQGGLIHAWYARRAATPPAA